MKSILFLTAIFLLYHQTTSFPTALWPISHLSLDRRRADDGIVEMNSRDVSLMSEAMSAGNERRDLTDRDTFNSSSGSSFTTDSSGSGGGGGGLSTSDKIAIGVGVPGGIGAVVAAFFAWWECWHKRRKRQQFKQPEHPHVNHPSPMFIVPTPAMAEMD